MTKKGLPAVFLLMSSASGMDLSVSHNSTFIMIILMLLTFRGPRVMLFIFLPFLRILSSASVSDAHRLFHYRGKLRLKTGSSFHTWSSGFPVILNWPDPPTGDRPEKESAGVLPM